MSEPAPDGRRPAAVALVLVLGMIAVVITAAVGYRLLGGCASGSDPGTVAAPADPPGDADRATATAVTTAGLPVTPLWSTGAAARGAAAIGASADTVFVPQRGSNGPDGSVLRAHDPATGAVRWQRTGPVLGATGTVLAAEGVAVVTGGTRDGRGEVAAFREPTGELLWCVRLSVGAPGLVDLLGDGADTVVLVERGGGTATVTALGTRDGRQRWRTEVPAAEDGVPVLAPGDDGVVALPGAGGARVVALDLATGTQRWDHDGPEHPQPLLGAPGRVVARTDGGAAGLAAADGTDAWAPLRGAGPGAPRFGWVDGDLAVLDRPGSGLLARRLSDGTVGWQLGWRDLGVRPPAGTPPAAATGGRRVVANGATVLVLDPATGAAGAGTVDGGALDALAADPTGTVLVARNGDRVTAFRPGGAGR
ncbi:PQQ-binding-like beta-propeller repeat protein [Pseudonocardia sp. H11422]|uniref:outer membrane protein assembly factor BamB family protein n=1 Tax=Pseudonocardia sp. H11422 TaxID=2835866 RepID=UPI002930A1FB|nr:PQQ-binding-like beta-propeller repeat protein [Pseudonocardia sp. H11422]